MNIRLAILLPFLAGLGACMMPMPAQQGGSGSGSGTNGPAPAGSPASSSPGGPASPSSSDGPPGSSAKPPAGPSTVSVDIHSDCPKTVKVFYGDKPKFGSGTYSSVESNSVSSHTFNSGDMFWIVDNDQNGVASVTVKSGMSQIEVSSDCTHLSAH